MEGRRSLKPSTLVRFQPSAPRFALAWCTVHRRIYKPLRSRLGARAGFDSQRQHHAFEAHQDEQAILNRQAVGSIPTGRTRFGNCGRMVRRSTFNRDGESSILSSSTNENVLPASSSG